MMIETFEDFIIYAREQGATDIYLTVESPTVFRINGEMVKYTTVSGGEDFSPVVVNRLIRDLLNADKEELVNEGRDVDFSFELSNGERQRVNVFHQCGKLACVIKLLNTVIPSAEELGLSKVITDLANKKSGLILITGPSVSGKNRTMAALINQIAMTRACHIITVEDPVEYKYKDVKATVHQREIGLDVSDYETALASALREDPDVIVLDEMRDYRTISLALTAAETGHLVIGSLHSAGASEAIDRIINVFPPHAQTLTRTQISGVIEGIIWQTLIPTVDKKDHVFAFEILLGTDAIRNLIRTDKTFQIDTYIQQNHKQGMCTINESLTRLYRRDLISYEEAMLNSNNREELEKSLKSVSF